MRVILCLLVMILATGSWLHAETAIGLPTPGAVPDGNVVHGNPLMLGRSATGEVELYWGDSCQGAEDFALFEGPIGAFYDHSEVTCSTGGLATHSMAASAGDHYYVISPILNGNEGSHGRDGNSVERSPGNSGCFPQLLGSPVCPVAGDWSDPDTWGGTAPLPGADVTIDPGQIVVLDTDVVVGELQISGELHCTNKDASITAETILVTGRLECGSEISPYTNRLTITLIGVEDANSPVGMGNKVLGAPPGGVIELHGAPRKSWTQLGATAPAGSTGLTLAYPVDWQPGDRVVIAPTHETYDEGEEVTLTDVSPDGLVLSFTPALAFDHYGEQSTYDNGVSTWTLDERGEVGLLTRNITIQGDDSSELTGFGGHVMIMPGAFARFSGVELFRMGQKSILARYPFHWHLAGSVPGQYIKNSGIHRSFNRCVTVHGADEALIEDNVCYDFLGHGYFLEDGIEQNNLFRDNLGVWARKPVEGEEILETDIRDATASNGPAAFWIGNPNNTFIGNVAAGSEGTGFWYGMPDHVTGPSAPANPGYNPQTAPFGEFIDNRVHSSRQGLSTCDEPSGPSGINPQTPLTFEGVVVNHTGQGIWPCVPQQTAMKMTFNGSIVANTLNGMQAPNPVAFTDSLFVGYTDNPPTLVLPGSNSNRHAVRVYDQGFEFDNVHFVNYDGSAMTAMLPGSGAHKHSNNRAQGLTFDNAPNFLLDLNGTTFVGAGPASWGDVVHDLDGSFVGQDRAVVADHPLMYDPSCVQPTDTIISGYACPYRYAHFRTENFTEISPVTILRSDGYTNTAPHIFSRYINEFILDPQYLYTYRYESGMRHQVVQVHLRNAKGGDTAVYELLDVPSSFDVNDNDWTEAPDLRALLDGPGRRYFYRDHSLFLKMEAAGADWHAVDVVDVCMTQGNCSLFQVRDLGQLPSVTITAPAHGERFAVGSDIQVDATLDDADHGIASARLYKGLALVGEKTFPPYTWTITNAQEGDYALKLVAEDSSGQTYTAVQQLFVGEAVPRVEITSPQDYLTYDSTASVNVTFDVHNWIVAAGGDHLHVFVNGVDQGHVFNAGSVAVGGLTQGRQEIKLALAEADETIRAVNDSVTVYVMEGGLVADYEDGVDLRSSLTPDSPTVAVTEIKFAWGTPDPVASRADGEDDINYYDVYNNDDGSLGTATYRLDLSPAQDWSGYSDIRIKSDGFPFDLWVVDAGEGATRIGSRQGQVTTLPLNFADAVLDEIVTIELRYDESLVTPGEFWRQHLYYVELLN